MDHIETSEVFSDGFYRRSLTGFRWILMRFIEGLCAFYVLTEDVQVKDFLKCAL